ncbi:MAG: hypothetical protein K940chlam8_00047 [Chlamydiae bacterium]|nr:hypothetical protein [Chlamydiota bacterium]
MENKFDMNPFVEIWTSPKKTIRAIVEAYPKYYLYFFATIQGLYALVNIFSSLRPAALEGMTNAIFIGIMILLTPLLGRVYFWINGWILKWVGSWFHGKASYIETRTVLAWSQVPIIFLIVIFLINQLAAHLFLGEALLEGTPLPAIIAQFPVWLFINSVATAVFGIWSLVIFFGGIAEVHQFSVWKAILTGIIAVVIWWLALSIFLTISALFANLMLAL